MKELQARLSLKEARLSLKDEEIQKLRTMLSSKDEGVQELRTMLSSRQHALHAIEDCRTVTRILNEG